MRRCLIVNEVKFTVYQSYVSGTNYDLNISADVELINIYSDILDLDDQLEVSFNAYHLSGTANTANPIVMTQPLSGTLDPAPGPHYTTVNITPGSPLSFIGVNGGVDSAFKLEINYIKFTKSGNILDYAFDEILESDETTISESPTNNHISAEVDDPRNNLDTDKAWDWECAGSCWEATSGDSGSIGSENLVLVADERPYPASASPVLETIDREEGATDPSDVSTAFIRNAPMKSLWELGAIHRKESWCTLNLGVYRDLTIAQTNDLGFELYTQGDANILDHVTLTSDSEVYGKVNINTNVKTVLKALFQGIGIGEDYDNSGATTTIDSNEAETLADSIHSLNGTTIGVGSEPFRSRGQIGQLTTATDAAHETFISSTFPNLVTDRIEEEIIGKVANLLTTRQNFFSVLVISQMVKDMTDGFKGGQIGVFDEGIDKILAEQRLFAVIYRDAITNEFTLYRYEYLD